jgi:hypothetical protein
VETSINGVIIQSLIGIEDKGDHIFVNLIENTPYNNGKQKLYEAVLYKRKQK